MNVESIARHGESQERRGLVTIAEVFPDANLKGFVDPATASKEALDMLPERAGDVSRDGNESGAINCWCYIAKGF
jgi:hypothetical protein